MVLTVDTGEPTAWLEPQGDYEFRYPEFSPDGRYVAYSSNENGKWGIYIRPFQGDGHRVYVSNGTELAWSSGGELFYRNGDKVMAVDINTTPDLKVLKQTALFTDTYETADGRPSRNYDVTADGTRFLMVRANPEGPEPPTVHIIRVTNWIEELQNKLSELEK